MPAWLVIAIVLVLVAMSSGKTKDAQDNAEKGSNNAEIAQQDFDKRQSECGVRCQDAINDYKKPIHKE